MKYAKTFKSNNLTLMASADCSADSSSSEASAAVILEEDGFEAAAEAPLTETLTVLLSHSSSLSMSAFHAGRDTPGDAHAPWPPDPLSAAGTVQHLALSAATASAVGSSREKKSRRPWTCGRTEGRESHLKLRGGYKNLYIFLKKIWWLFRQRRPRDN